MKIKPIQQIYTINTKQANLRPTFACQNDIFEKNNKTETIAVKKRNGDISMYVEYNGKDKAVIYKKIFNPQTKQIEKKPVKVCVGKIITGHISTYCLFDEKTKQRIGYVKLDDIKKGINYNFYEAESDSPIQKDYPQYGIIGDRISIDFVENFCPDEYSGIGEVADQIALEYCLKENLPLQIVSEAEQGSVIAHYKRGRKFLPVEQKKFLKIFMENFGTNDPNLVIEKRIKENPGNKNIYCKDIYRTYMYMPKEVVEKYLKRIKESPILH